MDDRQPLTAELFVPVVCLVTRGTKDVQLGQRKLRFVPGTFIVSAINFPITGHVVEAPYRAAAIHLTPGPLAGLLLEAPSAAPTADPAELQVAEATEALLEAMTRLLRLLDDEQDRAVLGEAAEREVLYRALQTPSGAIIRHFVREGHLVSRIDPAIEWIREHVAEVLSVDDLAERCHLSTSTLYRHFRSATGRTPLQFQKQIRLQEARKLLLIGETTAAGVATHVGYASASQFSREYARLFGSPPGQYATSWRNGASSWQDRTTI